MSNPDGVLCTGNLVVDIMVRPVEEIPWGQTANVEAIQEHTGGNGCNTSYALAMMGTRVRLIGMIGSDPFGDFVLQRLRGAGVDTGALRRSDAATATSIAMVSRSGARGFLHRLGASAEMTLTPEEFDTELAGAFRHYHLATPFGLPLLRPFLPELLRRAKTAGLTTSIDTQWDSAGRWMDELASCFPHTDILFANEDELRMLTGSADPEIAAPALLARGAKLVVAKLGPRGCAICSVEGHVPVPGFSVEAVDTTGAGDAFVGAFLSEWLRGRSLAESAHFANAVGAMAVGKLGAIEGLRSRAETEEWMGSRVPLPVRL